MIKLIVFCQYLFVRFHNWHQAYSVTAKYISVICFYIIKLLQSKKFVIIVTKALDWKWIREAIKITNVVILIPADKIKFWICFPGCHSKNVEPNFVLQRNLYFTNWLVDIFHCLEKLILHHITFSSSIEFLYVQFPCCILNKSHVWCGIIISWAVQNYHRFPQIMAKTDLFLLLR